MQAQLQTPGQILAQRSTSWRGLQTARASRREVVDTETRRFEMRTTLVPVLLVAALAPIAAQQTAPKQPSAKQQPTAAQHQHDPDMPIKGTGKMPDGWKVRFDDPAAKPDQVIVEEKDGALTFTTGPAGIYYKSD